MNLMIEDEVIIETIADDASVEAMRRRLMAYYEKLKEYLRAGEPDKSRLAELVVKAKGPKRSMRKFAEEMEISPSTLSRLVNQKTVGANSDDLIAKIATHADPESGVTFEELMEAHGMALKDARYRSASAYEKACHDIILAELRRREYAVDSAECSRLKGAGYGMEYDFAIRTNALKNGNGKWYFDCKLSSGSIGSAPYTSVGTGRSMQWLTMTMALFYCGAVDAERVSIVVEYRAIYEQLKERCKDVKIPNEISIILISIQEQRVVEEYLIPMVDGQEMPDVFYETGNPLGNDPLPRLEDAWDMSVFDRE